MQIEDGRTRVIIENVIPRVDAGEFPVKRVVGDAVTVEADVFTDGHDAISAALLYRPNRDPAVEWAEAAMAPLVGTGHSGDRWRGAFTVTEIGAYAFQVCGWVDHFKTWARDLKKRVDAGQDVAVDLIIGADLVADAANHARTSEDDSQAAAWLDLYAQTVRAGGPEAVERALSAELAAFMRRHAPRRYACMFRPLGVTVDRLRARFGAWYELFPRSTAPVPGRHGTFHDVINRLPYVSALGFDVLYLPPIHPIGRAFRKGPNNSTVSGPDDPGSPWAIGMGSIGAPEGGHKAIHAELGTLEDFHALVSAAASHGLELALDIAFQCSPDHPYVAEHPEWFRRRPDGTIQYAENPPKKYQDIYPFDFETEDWQALWVELKSVIQYWINQGVRIFRVDNPHTKAFPFWQWVIAELKRDCPEAIFLAEAFTRPRVLERLAKIGFTQSYNYFPWRNTKWELTEYLTELTRTSVKEYLGPNLWPNTPDILTEYLQYGGRPAHMVRFILAATLGPSYGIYGPVFELCENTPVAAGKEEYLNSEKYEIRHWDLAKPGSLSGLIGRVNQIRRDQPAFQANHNLRFHEIDNDQIIAYSKSSADGANTVLVVVNLDPHFRQAGFINLPLDELHLDPAQPYQMHDLLTDTRYLWSGPRNYVELNPATTPAHIFVIRRKVSTEQDFDYYL